MVYNRNTYEYKKWRKKVLLRDGFRCTKCGSEKHLEVHHIKSVAEYPDLALDVNNGTTLCTRCHYELDGRNYNEYKEYEREYDHQLSFTLTGFKRATYWLKYRLGIIRDLLIVILGFRRLFRQIPSFIILFFIILFLTIFNWIKGLFNITF